MKYLVLVLKVLQSEVVVEELFDIRFSALQIVNSFKDLDLGRLPRIGVSFCLISEYFLKIGEKPAQFYK